MHSLHLSILGIGWNGPSPNLDPDEDVAHGDEYHGEDVAEYEVSDNKVEDFAQGVRPDVEAETDVRAVFEHCHQVKREHPWGGHHDSEDPDKDDHHSRATFGDLTFEGPPYCQKSATIENFVNDIFENV